MVEQSRLQSDARARDPYPRSGPFLSVHPPMTAIRTRTQFVTNVVCDLEPGGAADALRAQLEREVAATVASRDGYAGMDAGATSPRLMGEHQVALTVRWDSKKHAEEGTALINAWFHDHKSRLGLLGYWVTLIPVDTGWQ